MANRKLTVYSIDLNDMKKTEMAEFSLVGDKVKSKFSNKMFEREMTKEGIYTPRGTYKPDDGKDFMDALEHAYKRSSTIIVERA
jgi:hypothetical protein